MKSIIVEHILEDARKFGVSIPPPAAVNDLRQCQKDLKERYLPPIPQRYFDFLRNHCNGYAWGIYFFGTKPIPYYNSGDCLEDLVTANETFVRRRPEMKRYFHIGWGDGVEYLYNRKRNVFEVRSRRGEPEYDNCEYETFRDMFECEEMKIK